MTQTNTIENAAYQTRILFLFPQHLSWWIWLITACSLTMGLSGMHSGFLFALVLSVLQTLFFYVREGRLAAFPVQLRAAYTLLLVICFFSNGHLLFWLPTIGTFALNFFGYCLMARVLALMPWNRVEPITSDLLIRTFFSRPVVVEQLGDADRGGCSGGVCSIEAQVRQRTSSSS